MQFTKMHGAGNDYVFVDCFSEPMPANPGELARVISHRHFGVGSDGLILICPSEVADVRMRMFNADGSEAAMCGNGIRCLAKYVYQHGMCRKNPLRVETGAGVKEVRLSIEGDRVVGTEVDLGIPILKPAAVPTTLRAPSGDAESPVVDQEVEIGGIAVRLTALSMGNPHAVLFVEQMRDDLVRALGPKLERAAFFPERANVEFVEVISPREVKMRVWERGSGETMACGTGAAAVCVAGVLTGRTVRKLEIHALGGLLEAHWSEEDGRVYLSGSAEEVFRGQWLGSSS